jgi:hypothetical protein
MQITDIFGNSVQVNDLEKAIEQAENYIEFSKKKLIYFEEFRIIHVDRQHGKRTEVWQTPKNPKMVKNLDFYQHQLQQLLKLKK